MLLIAVLNFCLSGLDVWLICKGMLRSWFIYIMLTIWLALLTLSAENEKTTWTLFSRNTLEKSWLHYSGALNFLISFIYLLLQDSQQENSRSLSFGEQTIPGKIKQSDHWIWVQEKETGRERTWLTSLIVWYGGTILILSGLVHPKRWTSGCLRCQPHWGTK